MTIILVMAEMTPCVQEYKKARKESWTNMFFQHISILGYLGFAYYLKYAMIKFP